MSTQVAVRLPDDMVVELDALIASGQASRRASVVEAALRRELREYHYARELAILAAELADPDLEALHQWVARHQPCVD